MSLQGVANNLKYEPGNFEKFGYVFHFLYTTAQYNQASIFNFKKVQTTKT